MAASSKAQDLVLQADEDIYGDCASREITKFLSQDSGPKDGTFKLVEKWIVNSCGEEHAYIVRFRETGVYPTVTTHISVRPASGKIPESAHVKNLARKNGCEKPGKPETFVDKTSGKRLYVFNCNDRKLKFVCGAETKGASNQSCWLQ